jgi:hypothetical protein
MLQMSHLRQILQAIGALICPAPRRSGNSRIWLKNMQYMISKTTNQ